MSATEAASRAAGIHGRADPDPTDPADPDPTDPAGPDPTGGNSKDRDRLAHARAARGSKDRATSGQGLTGHGSKDRGLLVHARAARDRTGGQAPSGRVPPARGDTGPGPGQADSDLEDRDRRARRVARWIVAATLLGRSGATGSPRTRGRGGRRRSEELPEPAPDRGMSSASVTSRVGPTAAPGHSTAAPGRTAAAPGRTPVRTRLGARMSSPVSRAASAESGVHTAPASDSGPTAPKARRSDPARPVCRTGTS